MTAPDMFGDTGSPYSKWPEGQLLLEIAIDLYKPVASFALFSGGHDSLCSTHRAMSTGLVQSVAHIDTGIGIKDTRDFVRKTCQDNAWNLEYLKAEDCGQYYDEIVLKFGFPGPFAHGLMYQRLKERPLNKLIKTAKNGHKRSSCVMLVSGVRSHESARRMGHVKPIQKQGSYLWVNINHNWTAEDNDKYMAKNNLPRNQVKDRLCMSGECLCGAFAKKNELQEIKFWYPEVAARIERLQKEELKKGRWGWEGQPPQKQDAKPEDYTLDLLDSQPMCIRCNSQFYEHDALQPIDYGKEE